MNKKALQLEIEKERLVREIFISTGDEDYITARWLFLNRLPRQFFWSAAQSLEKYLKASLLLNGYPANNYGHDLVKLFKKVKVYSRDLIPSILKPPEQVSLFSECKDTDLWHDPTIEKFISRVNEHGNASNRYDYFGFEAEFSDLYKLDQVVFSLRNVAVKLDSFIDIDNPNKTSEDLLREFPERQLSKFGSHLVEQDEAQRPVYEAACENNFPFAPKSFRHKKIPLYSHMHISHLEILFKIGMGINSSDLRNWVTENIRIHPDEVAKIKHL